MFKYIALSLFILSSAISNAQITGLESLTVEDGLSQGMIFDIAKDQDGFMWFATKGGLNRYDGYTFKVFTHDSFDSTSIAHDQIDNLFVDSKNRLWTTSALSVYDKNKEQFQKIGVHIDSYNIIEDRAGNLWAGAIGREKGDQLYKITEIPAANQDFPQFKVELKARLKPSYSIRALQLLSDGTILVGGHHGLFKWNEKTNQLEPFVAQKLGAINSIVEYPKGTVWVKSHEDFHKIQNGIVTRIKLSVNIPHIKIKLDPVTHKIWFYHNSVFQKKPLLFGIDPLKIKGDFLDITTAEHIDVSSNLHASSIFLEEGRTLWIGANGYGIRKASLQKYPFRHLAPKNSPRDLEVWKDGKLFVKDLTNYDWNSSDIIVDRWDFLQFFGASRVRILPIQGGETWALIVKKIENKETIFLVQFNEKFEIEKSYPVDNFYREDTFYEFLLGGLSKSFIEGSNNCFWWGTSSKGLIKFDKDKETFELIKNQQEKEIGRLGRQNSLYQDKVGNIWMINGSPGLVKASFNEAGEATFQRYKNDPTDVQSLSNNSTLCVHDDLTDPETYLWVGTRGGGLNKMNKKTGKFQHFTTKDGLPDNVIYGILSDDDGNFWLSTNQGLSKFNPTTETFTNFVKADGLQDDEFNTNSFVKNEKTGELYFGGINGITVFHPKDIQLSTFEPKVHITQLKIHGELVELGNPLEQRGNNPLTKPIEFTEKIRLPWYQNQITLDFASLDFSNPEKNLYQYQLSSVDKKWVNAGNRHSVNYSNLTVGTYTFRVRGTNSDGVWSSQETVLKIVIYPPWYRTNLAYLIYAILLILGVYKLYQDQIRRAKLRNELEFEQKEAIRLAEMDKIKTNFFSNITHEFRTPLTLIIEPLRQVLGYDEMPLRSKKKVELAERNSQRLLGLVNQLLDLSKLEGKKMNLELKRGDFLEFVEPIMASFETLAKKKDIDFVYHAPNALPFFDFDKNKVEKVLFNLISNAIKFTKAKGTVTVNIVENKAKETVNIQVVDTGIGIPEKEQPHIFDRFYQVDGSNTREHEGTGIGLALSKELTEVMNGQLTFESILGKGTTFEFAIPMVQMNVSDVANTIEEPTLALNNVMELAAFTPTISDPILISPDATNVALIIEDNEELRAFIKSSIEHKYQVIEARNGKEGLALAMEHIPNIVISDVMMPMMDGFEVCQRLKTNEKTAHIPVILLTAKTAMDSRIQGLKYGADAYMNKPFNTEELLLRMRNLIIVRQELQQKFSQVIEKVVEKNIEPTKINKGKIEITDANLSSFDQSFLNNLYDIVQKHLDDETFTVELLIKKIGTSKTQLHRKMKALLNQSPTQFIRNIRLKTAYELLQQQKGNVTEVAFMVGFSNSKYFSTKFKEKYGMSPSKI